MQENTTINETGISRNVIITFSVKKIGWIFEKSLFTMDINSSLQILEAPQHVNTMSHINVIQFLQLKYL